jgi:FAD:protein FMN transferase
MSNISSHNDKGAFGPLLPPSKGLKTLCNPKDLMQKTISTSKSERSSLFEILSGVCKGLKALCSGGVEGRWPSTSLRWLKALSIIGLVGLSSGCYERKKALEERRGIAMTIPYMVLVDRGGEGFEKVIAETFEKVDRIFNKWNEGSEVSRLNRSEGRFECSEELWDLLVEIDRFVRISEGRFDPTVEKLERIWKESLARGITPKEDEVEAIMHMVGWEKLKLMDGRVIEKENAGVEIDLGGIAKGRAVDMLVKNLRTAGYTNIFVEWGGEVRAMGGHPEGRPWKVGVKNPRNREELVTTLELYDRSIATSGDYEQEWIADDGEQIRHFFHLFDKSRHSPCERSCLSLESVTVVDESCMVADALASILLLIGNKKEAEAFFEEKIRPEFETVNCYMIGHDEEVRYDGWKICN